MNFLRRCSVPTAIFAGMRHFRRPSPLFAAVVKPTPSDSYNITTASNISLRERLFGSSVFAQPKPDETVETEDAKSQKVQQKWTYTDRAYQQVAKHRLHANGVDDPRDAHDLELEGAEYDASTRIQVHKRILIAASPYFAKKFENIEARSAPCNGDGTQCSVMEFDHGNLKRICDFIYTGTFQLSNREKHGDAHRQLYNTLDAAKLLQIPELETACVRALLSPAFFNTDDEQACSDIIDTWMYAKARGNKVLLEKVVRKFAKIFPADGRLGDSFLQLGELDAIGVLDELKKRVNGNEALSKAAIYWLNANWPLLKHDVHDENGDDAKNWDALEYMLWYADLSDNFKLDVEQKLLKERKLERDSIEEFKMRDLHKSRQVHELLEDSKAYRAKLDALRAQKRELRQQLLKSQLYEFAERDRVRESATFRTKRDHKADDVEIAVQIKVGKEVQQAINENDEEDKQRHREAEESAKPPKNADEQVNLSRREISEIKKQLRKLETIWWELADRGGIGLYLELSGQTTGDSFSRQDLREMRQKVTKMLHFNAEEGKVIEELSLQVKAAAKLERRRSPAELLEADGDYREEDEPVDETDEEKKQKQGERIVKLMLSGGDKEEKANKTNEPKVMLPRRDLYLINIPLQALRQFSYHLHNVRAKLWHRMTCKCPKCGNEFTRHDLWVTDQLVKQMFTYHRSDRKVMEMLLRHLSDVEARWETYEKLVQLSRKEIREMNEQVVKLKADCLESEKINEMLLGQVKAAQERRKVLGPESDAEEIGKPLKD